MNAIPVMLPSESEIDNMNALLRDERTTPNLRIVLTGELAYTAHELAGSPGRPAPRPTIAATEEDVANMGAILNDKKTTPYVRSVMCREWSNASERAADAGAKVPNLSIRADKLAALMMWVEGQTGCGNAAAMIHALEGDGGGPRDEWHGWAEADREKWRQEACAFVAWLRA